MDQIVIESLQHLRLTKEEEEDIAILTMSRSYLMEECALSLFGKLLSNRQQKQKALKSTLRAAWKMGYELRIVDVGKDILQFKFISVHQMECVERKGPWNFDNNLLLMCRWKKGLSVSNISFTHSPFWVQVWGLLFENLSEEVGRDLGNSLGRYIEIDKHSWLSKQAKFMRIWVDWPLNKPFRRGGNVVNLDGSKTWVTFKFEKLLCFLFQCGLLGHNERHYTSFPYNPDSPKQYGVWLKVDGNSKEFSERSKASSSRSQDDDELGKLGDDLGGKSAPVTASSVDLNFD